MYVSYWFLPTCKMQSPTPLFLLHAIWLQCLMLSHVISVSPIVLPVPYNIYFSPAEMFPSQWINYHSTCKLPLKFTWKLASVYSAISRGHLTMVFASLAPQISLIVFCDFDWAGNTHDRKSIVTCLFYMGPKSSLGPLRSNPLLLNLQHRLNIELYSDHHRWTVVVTGTIKETWWSNHQDTAIVLW